MKDRTGYVVLVEHENILRDLGYYMAWLGVTYGSFPDIENSILYYTHNVWDGDLNRFLNLEIMEYGLDKTVDRPFLREPLSVITSLERAISSASEIAKKLSPDFLILKVFKVTYTKAEKSLTSYDRIAESITCQEEVYSEAGSINYKSVQNADTPGYRSITSLIDSGNYTQIDNLSPLNNECNDDVVFKHNKSGELWGATYQGWKTKDLDRNLLWSRVEEETVTITRFKPSYKDVGERVKRRHN